MDLENLKISLGAVLGLLGTLAGIVATIVAWLGRSAYTSERRLLQLQLDGMAAQTLRVRDECAASARAAYEEASRARDEARENQARIVALEKNEITMGGKLLAIDKTASEAVDQAEAMRASMVSKEYLAGEFRTQNVTLAHQNEVLKEIKTELGRKVSVANMPAVTPRGDTRRER